MNITITPIAFVKNNRLVSADDYWEEIISEITLAEHIPTEALDHIEDFSHLEILFYFDKVKDEDIIFSGRPRGNPVYPEAGVFAQRKKDRPNKLGLSRVELLEHKGRTIKVKYLDAINGTPILDIKPVFKEFQAGSSYIKQPDWVSDMAKHYWK